MNRGDGEARGAAALDVDDYRRKAEALPVTLFPDSFQAALDEPPKLHFSSVLVPALSAK
jgi:hypothetical protein